MDTPEQLTANQYPHEINRVSRWLRQVCSLAPLVGLVSRPERPVGISVIMRIKDERDWIRPSVESIGTIADEVIVVDHGSTDGTCEILDNLKSDESLSIKMWSRPELDFCELSNFALEQTRFQWVFRWDGDMVAQTKGDNNISGLRDRILSLDPRRYHVVYLRQVNLAGDLFHHDPNEMVHIEEYLHTYSDAARFIHPGRFEAVKFPKYYQPHFWYEPYIFHVNVKPARKMLLRYFWEEWMERKDYRNYPGLEDFVDAMIGNEFGTDSWQEAEKLCVQRICRDFIRYDPDMLAPYPALLEPYLMAPAFKLEYEGGKIVGRTEKTP